MHITNNASFPVIAIAVWRKMGGKEVVVNPGQSRDVPGPCIANLEDGRRPTIVVPGAVICQETSDETDNQAFQILPGQPIFAGDSNFGIHIRHHRDPEPFSDEM